MILGVALRVTTAARLPGGQAFAGGQNPGGRARRAAGRERGEAAAPRRGDGPAAAGFVEAVDLASPARAAAAARAFAAGNGFLTGLLVDRLA